ncbi:single-stranded DNA-binding protein [Weissella koreensis KCTC 3621]|uniref:single-stranded DNA-binding protein n=1 Tax=Weissella koreensis TaxID=165096 RepID=UPI00026F3EE7|nr:single-stranded DNA-binding protein [Weissella koreensis]EJF33743.1 single-stranded DNA-binding protein [Weissella koreensis KCTC 3621]
MNSVVLVGRIVRDVELRYTQAGTAVASFSIAVDRRFKSKNGDKEVDFINATIWAKSAENFVNFTHKGSRVAISGRLETGSYQNKEGQTVYTTEVTVENFDLLETRAESQASNTNTGNVSTGANKQSPFTQQVANNDPFGSGQEVDISDDDLPF